MGSGFTTGGLVPTPCVFRGRGTTGGTYAGVNMGAEVESGWRCPRFPTRLRRPQVGVLVAGAHHPALDWMATR